MGSSVRSPHSNRGVDNTTKTVLVPLVDWLQVTFSFLSDPYEILYLLEGLYDIDTDDFYSARGRYYYQSSLTNDEGITVFYDGLSDNMGTHLQISGRGCRFLEKNKCFTWSSFFKSIHELAEILGNGEGYNCTRLDLAIDDFKTYFSVDEVIRKLENAEITSKLQHSQYMKSLNISDAKSKGSTVYFGKSDGVIQIRFYEKYYELLQQGYNMKDKPKNWNRYEIQLRRDRSDFVFQMIKDDADLSDTIKSILNSYIKIRTRRKDDDNRSRWPIWHKWKKFIEDVSDFKITISYNELDLEKQIRWVNKQVSKVLAKIDIADGKKLNEIIENAKLKLDEKDKRQIKNYKKKRQKGAIRKNLQS